MKKNLHFETIIAAPRKHVWNTMLGSESYPQWTIPFAEGSYFEGSWEEGDTIRFLSPEGEGMLSEIARSTPSEFVSIRHVGFIKDGVEDTESEEVRKWAPSYENYSFSDAGGSTKVEVDLEVEPDWEKMMADMWPRALAKLKEISESSRSAD